MKNIIACLNTPRAFTIACVLVPLCFGLYSLWLGVDANGDLFNYHLYNAYAWLHGKLQIDLAPAGMQTYFNPMLDVPYYLASLYLPSRVVAFLMGFLHGLAFVLLLGVIKNTLLNLADVDRYRAPLLLALAGCLMADFLSCLGNTMGDNATALFIFAGLWVLMAQWGKLDTSFAIIITAGVFVGLAAGLKLTNAIYAIALCLALLSYPSRISIRLRIATLFALGVFLSFAATGGYWMLKMWRMFGNPLYPQFSAIFPNPLTASHLIVDTRFFPHNWIETIFWPFVFSMNPARVCEIVIHQIVWPVLYVLLCFWLLLQCWRFIKHDDRTSALVLDARARFILLFIVISFILWLKIFSIYRYLTAIEMLAPLAIWILLHQLVSPPLMRRWSALLIATAVIVAITGTETWGHVRDWHKPMWNVETPTIAQPEQTMVIMESPQIPIAWLATQFSDKITFVQIGAYSFPESPAFRLRVLEMAKQHQANLFALINGARGGASGKVMFENKPLMDNVNFINIINRFHRNVSAPVFKRYGYTLNATSCVPYAARIGKSDLQGYQWCKLTID